MFQPIWTDARLLLHPNIPKPMHGVNPRSVMGEAWWNKMRRRAYKDNNYCCGACSVHKSEALYFNCLEAHEDYFIDYQKCTIEIKRIVPLCHACHNYIHSGRLLMLAMDAEIKWEKFFDIIKRGNEILSQNGLEVNPFARAALVSAVDYLPFGVPIWAKFEASKVIDVDALPGVEVPIGGWSKWRMILEGKQYPPLHKSYGEWLAHYGHETRSLSISTLVDVGYLDMEEW
jgi:hypothetical protein